MGSGKDEVVSQHNENDGPGRCSCWIHRRRRLAINGAPWDEFSGTDADLERIREEDGKPPRAPGW